MADMHLVYVSYGRGLFRFWRCVYLGFNLHKAELVGSWFMAIEGRQAMIVTRYEPRPPLCILDVATLRRMYREGGKDDR